MSALEKKSDDSDSSPFSSTIIIDPQECEGEKEQTLSSQVASFLWGEVVGTAQVFERWVALVRKRSGKFKPSGFPHRLAKADSMPFLMEQKQSATELISGELYDFVDKSFLLDQAPEMSLWERLGNAATLNIESSAVTWSCLSSLHHTEHTNNNEHSEDELNKALEVTVNSGGVVFFALFNNLEDSLLLPNEVAAVIKITSSRLTTLSECLGYEFARWLGVRTPQARVVHNFSTEWQIIKDATKNACIGAVSVGDEVGEMTCSELLEALEMSRCILLMKNSEDVEKDEYRYYCSPRSTDFGFSNPMCKERPLNESHADSSDSETHRNTPKSSPRGESEHSGSSDSTSSNSRGNWSGKYFKGNGEQSNRLRLTMKLRDFHKFVKADVELNKELEQWIEMLRMDVVKFCQENNFNTGFFDGNDSTIIIDAYELKVRLEHILDRIALISDAMNTERPSQVTDGLFIGGALAAKSLHTLQYLGITHILCLCLNEIGQSDSQRPEFFEYKNFFISDNDEEDISSLFVEACDFIAAVINLGGKVLVHCFEGKSRSATVVLAYLMMRNGLTLSESWNILKKMHRRAQPNDGFAKVLLELDLRLHGKVSMDWQHKKPVMKVCPICGKNAGLSTSSLKLHLQNSHRRISVGSVDSGLALETLKIFDELKVSSAVNNRPSKVKSRSLSHKF